MIGSLRMRLFWSTLLVTAVLLAILAYGIDQAVHRTLLREFDDVLLEKARALASMVEQDPDGVHFEYQPAEFPEFETGPHAAYFDVFVDGRAFARSASLSSGDLPAAADTPQRAGVQPSILPNKAAGRMLALAFVPSVDPEQQGKIPSGKKPEATVAVAQDTTILNRTMGRIRLLTGLLCGSGVVLSGLVLLLVTSRAVRPVHELAKRIGTLDQNDLSVELNARRFPTEFKPIVERLNGLLDRLQKAFVRERAFTADVAHELRTPLAGLLATLEVCRSRPRSSEEYQAAIEKCLTMLTQMQGLAERLLLLARAESGQLKIHTRAVDLGELIDGCRAVYQAEAGKRGLSFAIESTGGSGDQAVSGDRDLLRIVVSNLLDNAVSYAEPDSEIALHLTQVGRRVTLEIASVGHALADGDLPHLFERFWRKDTARAHTGLHAGLGLSLVQRLVGAQNGEIAIRIEGRRFIALLEMPVAERTEPSPKAKVRSGR